MDVADNTGAVASFNRAEKVVTAWLHEYPRTDAASRAAPLPLEGERSFSALVKRYSGDMPVRAVLDELLRVGVARRMESGDIELLSGGPVVIDAKDRQALLAVFGHDTADFIGAISHNVTTSNEKKFYQRTAWSDNLPIEMLVTTKEIARQRGQILMDDLTSELSKLDRDITPTVGGTGRARAVFGVYYYEEITEHGTQEPLKAIKKSQ